MQCREELPEVTNQERKWRAEKKHLNIGYKNEIYDSKNQNYWSKNQFTDANNKAVNDDSEVMKKQVNIMWNQFHDPKEIKWRCNMDNE